MHECERLPWQGGGGVYISGGQVTFQSSNIYENTASVRTCLFWHFNAPWNDVRDRFAPNTNLSGRSQIVRSRILNETSFHRPVQLTLLLVSCHIIIYCSSSSLQ